MSVARFPSRRFSRAPFVAHLAAIAMCTSGFAVARAGQARPPALTDANAPLDAGPAPEPTAAPAHGAPAEAPRQSAQPMVAVHDIAVGPVVVRMHVHVPTPEARDAVEAALAGVSARATKAATRLVTDALSRRMTSSDEQWVPLNSLELRTLQAVQRVDRLSNGAFGMLAGFYRQDVDAALAGGAPWPSAAEWRDILATSTTPDLPVWDMLELDVPARRASLFGAGYLWLGVVREAAAIQAVIDALGPLLPADEQGTNSAQPADDDRTPRSAIAGVLLRAGPVVWAVGERAPGAPWRIGVQDPGGPGAFAVIRGPGAVVTRGDFNRRMVKNGRVVHDVVDPRSGELVTNCQQVAVVDTDVLRAAALAEAGCTMGARGALSLLSRLRTPSAIVVDGRGNITVGNRIKSRVRIRAVTARGP